jgi:hypothetical protein
MLWPCVWFSCDLSLGGTQNEDVQALASLRNFVQKALSKYFSANQLRAAYYGDSGGYSLPAATIFFSFLASLGIPGRRRYTKWRTAVMGTVSPCALGTSMSGWKP